MERCIALKINLNRFNPWKRIGNVISPKVSDDYLTVGGNVSGQSSINSGLVVNNGGGNAIQDDFRVETGIYENAFVVDASEDTINCGVDVYVTADNLKIHFGTGDDVEIYYDGTDAIIDTAVVNPSDLIIDCGTDKTVELAESVWNDIQFNVESGRTAAANFPDWDKTFTANTGAYKFDVDDYIHLGSNEMKHDWKEGTSIYPHIHVALDGANVSGVSQYVKFTIYIAYADDGSVFTETSKDVEVEIPTGTADLTHLITGATALSMTGLKVGTQLNLRVKRIAATTGTEYPNHIFLKQVGIHYEIDTLGSRQIFIK